MVESQLRSRGIHDQRVLDAMARVPRHAFLSPQRWNEAYADHPVIIPEQQTTSQPYMIASMLQSARVEPGDRALEIGAGSGYQTALLAELAAQVVAVERYESLASQARESLERLGYNNATVITGDGSLGAPQFAPFNVIVVSAAAPRIPPSLAGQLAPGGRLVIPVGDENQQMLQLVRKQEDGSITVRDIEACKFVPLIGEEGW